LSRLICREEEKKIIVNMLGLQYLWTSVQRFLVGWWERVQRRAYKPTAHSNDGIVYKEYK
jgi:hypothetical protein